MSQSHQNQEYWLPGFGLSRQIVFGHLQYFLGPTATVRPYSYQGREGYLINGMPLTRQQIDDLQNLSQEYERQAALRMNRPTSGTQANNQHWEPYINEPVRVGPGRRTSPEYSSRRTR